MKMNVKMTKIKSLIVTTPDGFVDANDAIFDPEFYEFWHCLVSETATIAFGRNTFEIFQDKWPARCKKENATSESQMKLAMAMNDKHKVVYTSTLKATIWNNSTIS